MSCGLWWTLPHARDSCMPAAVGVVCLTVPWACTRAQGTLCSCGSCENQRLNQLRRMLGRSAHIQSAALCWHAISIDSARAQHATSALLHDSHAAPPTLNAVVIDRDNRSACSYPTWHLQLCLWCFLGACQRLCALPASAGRSCHLLLPVVASTHPSHMVQLHVTTRSMQHSYSHSFDIPTHNHTPTLTHRTKDVFVNSQKVVIRYNDTCHFYQPPRAHHCSVNDNCIERFDHHCPWVGTTIGKVRGCWCGRDCFLLVCPLAGWVCSRQDMGGAWCCRPVAATPVLMDVAAACSPRPA